LRKQSVEKSVVINKIMQKQIVI